MFKVKITAKDGSKWSIDAKTLEEANAAKAAAEFSGVYGKPDRWLTTFQILAAGLPPSEITRMVLDLLGEEHIEYFYPAEYTIEIEDITAQVEAEEKAKKDKADARLLRIQQLKSMNVDSLTTIAQIKPLLKILLAEILKDEQ